MPNSVRVFQSTDTGAPALSGTAGTLIAVLDACLQDGYGAVTIDTLVVASDVATVTDSTGHGFTMLGTVGPVVRISGATPAGLNGDWRITVTSATAFTFTTSGISDQTASGTIVCKRAPAGFTKAFSGTNLAAYRSDDVTGTRLYLRVDDTAGLKASLAMYETMSDVNTGTGTHTATLMAKSDSSPSRAWTIITDSRFFYCFSGYNSAVNLSHGCCFGDFLPFKSGDTYACVLMGNDANPSYGLHTMNGGQYTYIARSYTQLGSAVSGLLRSLKVGTQDLIGVAGSVFPNAVDNSFHAWPIDLWESGTLIRGRMPGFYNPLHSGLTNQAINNVDGINNGTILVLSAGSYTRPAFDITGPWR